MKGLTLHRHESRLDIPIATELVPTDLHVDAEDQIGPVGRLARGLHPFAPAPLQREATEHRRLARPGCRAARHVTVAGSVPHATDHVHAATLKLGRLRIFILIDHILIRRFRHQTGGIRRHPGRDERSQVQAGAAVEQQLVRHHVVRHPCPGAVLGKLVTGQTAKLLLLHHRGGSRAAAVADLRSAGLSRGTHVGLPFVRLGTRAWRGRSSASMTPR